MVASTRSWNHSYVHVLFFFPLKPTLIYCVRLPVTSFTVFVSRIHVETSFILWTSLPISIRAKYWVKKQIGIHEALQNISVSSCFSFDILYVYSATIEYRYPRSKGFETKYYYRILFLYYEYAVIAYANLLFIKRELCEVTEMPWKLDVYVKASRSVYEK